MEKINDDITLIQGDCLEHLKKIECKSISAIITDPPYFLGLTHNGKRGNFDDLAIAKPFFTSLFEEFKRVLKDDGSVYFFCDWRGYAFYYILFDAIIGTKNLLVWDKVSGTGRFYAYSHEFILFYTGKKNIRGGCNIVKNIRSFSNQAQKTNGEKIHPTQKPIELMEKLILDSTNEGEVVLDPFMGSGTTGVACVNLKRCFTGIELQEKYIQIAKKRVLETLQKRD